MRQVRYGVFETNSSSTHSVCICTEEEFNKFNKGELWYDTWNEKFIEPIKETTVNDEDVWERAEREYTYHKDPYYKEWKDLEDNLKQIRFDKTKSEMLKEKEDVDMCDIKQDYREWVNSQYAETYENYRVLPNGEKIYVFGVYGYDG